jgi:hypothetical protein
MSSGRTSPNEPTRTRGKKEIDLGVEFRYCLYLLFLFLYHRTATLLSELAVVPVSKIVGFGMLCMHCFPRASRRVELHA